MEKIKNTIITILIVFTKIMGLLFCVVALSFIKDKDILTALFSLIIGVAVYFIPDIIRKRNS